MLYFFLFISPRIHSVLAFLLNPSSLCCVLVHMLVPLATGVHTCRGLTNFSKQPLPGKPIGHGTSGSTVHGSGKQSRTFGGRWVYGPTSFFGRGRRPTP